LPKLAKKAIKSHLADFESAADEFARLANRLVERGNALARDPVARARVQAMIERARMLQTGVLTAKGSLHEAKQFLGEAIGYEAATGPLFTQSADAIVRGVTKALQWFNRDAGETIARLEAGTLNRTDALRIGGAFAALAGVGALLWRHADKVQGVLKMIGGKHHGDA
jgi:hypothetical protein